MKQTTELPANRLYKSRIFAMLYQDKKELLDLYNAHQWGCGAGNPRMYWGQNRAEAKQVSIYEYDEEKHMRQEREASWEEGWEEGRLSGIKEGEERGKLSGRRELLKELIQKKLLKKMSVSEIAEELEEDEKLISELIQELE